MGMVKSVGAVLASFLTLLVSIGSLIFTLSIVGGFAYLGWLVVRSLWNWIF